MTAVVAKPSRAKSSSGSNWWRHWGEESLSAYLFLLPSIIIFVTFTFFPAIYSIVVSLFRWNMPAKAVFIGFENYRYLFTDPLEAPIFWKSIFNTFYFTLGVPLNLFVSLMIALLLIIERQNPLRAIAYSLGIVLVTYASFVYGLKTPLPEFSF